MRSKPGVGIPNPLSVVHTLPGSNKGYYNDINAKTKVKKSDNSDKKLNASGPKPGVGIPNPLSAIPSIEGC